MKNVYKKAVGRLIYAFKKNGAPLMAVPTESVAITENGEHDVMDYATANVDISSGVSLDDQPTLSIAINTTTAAASFSFYVAQGLRLSSSSPGIITYSETGHTDALGQATPTVFKILQSRYPVFIYISDNNEAITNLNAVEVTGDCSLLAAGRVGKYVIIALAEKNYGKAQSYSITINI